MPESQNLLEIRHLLEMFQPGIGDRRTAEIDPFDARHVADEFEGTVVDLRAAELNRAAPRLVVGREGSPKLLEGDNRVAGGKDRNLAHSRPLFRTIGDSQSMTSGRTPTIQNNRLLGTGQILPPPASWFASHLDTVVALSHVGFQ